LKWEFVIDVAEWYRCYNVSAELEGIRRLLRLLKDTAGGSFGNDLENSSPGETCTTAAEYSGNEERVMAADCNEDSL
jgi:hypothetical protein